MNKDPVRHNEHRPRLGRGLAALLGDNHDENISAEPSHAIRKAPIELLRPNPRNPRKAFAERELEELTASIRARGIIQPIMVRSVTGGGNAYEIIAGERRWRAAQRAGQHEIPILIVEANDRESLEIAIVENIQRTDLNALEEANGYAQLAEHGYNHSDIAAVVGKSRSHVANTLRLANLPEHTRALLSSGKISAGHARALLAVADPDSLADRVVSRGLTVRDVESFAERPDRAARHPTQPVPVANPDTRALEEKLSDTIGAKVTIRHVGDTGEIRIAFRSFEQLDDFCQRLAKPLSR
jgi:ParB family transcriptional regulator, chromosome partitioning protein